MTWLLAACTAASPAIRRLPPQDAPATPTAPTPTSTPRPAPTSATTSVPSTSGATGDTAAPEGPCPPEMADVDGIVCVDRWEAYLGGWSPYEVPSDGVAVAEAGAIPQGYISGDVAADACAAAGKRLCTLDEWLLACAGAAGRVYPYGDVYVPGACNEGRAVHPVVELFGAATDWSTSQMNDPRLNQLPDSLAASGAYADCVTPDGVYDLHGNLHEWIDDPAGTFKGGFYVDATLNGPGCSYVTTAHTTDYHDYSTGFRCCAAPAR